MFRFLKSALLDGAVILLPVLFLIVILREFFELLIGLATPLADLLPPDIVDNFPEINVLAMLILLAGSALAGILARLPPVAFVGRSVDVKVLEKIPVYRPLKFLLRALLGADAASRFKPALITGDDKELAPGYVVEDIGRARVLVLIPWTPNSFGGTLKFLPRERVHLLEMTFDEFSLAISHFGVGLSERLADIPDSLKLNTRPDTQPNTRPDPGPGNE